MTSPPTTNAKPALVFVCQRLPNAPTTGDRIPAYHLLRHLATRYRVFVGTCIDDVSDEGGVDALRAKVAGLHVAPAYRPWTYLRALPRWLAGEPLSFAVFRSRALARWLDEIEAKEHPVAVVAFSSNMATYVVDRFSRNGGRDPVRLLHFCDVDSQKFVDYATRASGLARWLLRLEATRVRAEELRLAARADAVAFVSDDEADLFRALLPAHRERVFTLSNGVDLDLFDPRRYPDAPFVKSGPVLMFTGAMDYRANIEAVTWFCAHVLPAIRDALPDVRFMIVGARPSPAVQRLAARPGVVVTGRVPSVAAYLAHADVVVAPLLVARGIQNKVMEAMAMAKPIVASPAALVGIRAVAGQHLACAETPREWVDQCLRLLHDPQAACELGRAARERMRETHDWQKQLARVDPWLSGVSSSRQVAAPCAA
jgi:sugar transferase (PEP-CTERM/EpsH1 system associated)